MKLRDFIKSELTFVYDQPADRDALLEQLAKVIADELPDMQADEIFKSLLAREEQGATSTPEGVALPHAMIAGLEKASIAVALLKKGCDFQQGTHPPSDLIFTLIGPEASAWEHLRLLARIARVCHGAGALANLRSATDGTDLYERLVAEDAKHG